MKTSISSVWLVSLVITFIFIFSGYLAVTVSYSRAFKMKNEILTIIEKHKGMTYRPGTVENSKILPSATITKNPGAFQTINLYLAGNSYNVTGQCDVAESGEEPWYGVKDLGVGKQYSGSGGGNENTLNVTSITNIVKIDSNTVKDKYFYCFQIIFNNIFIQNKIRSVFTTDFSALQFAIFLTISRLGRLFLL